MAKYGLQYTKPDPMMVIQTRHEGVVKIPSGPEQVAATIAEYSEHDSAAYLEMVSEWAILRREYARRQSGTPDVVVDSDPERAAALDRILAMSGYEMVAERFEDQRTQDLVLTPAMIFPLRRPGTGFFPMHFAGALSQTSWPMPVGGSGALAEALVSSIEADDGRVLCGRPVEMISVESGRAAALFTGDGERFEGVQAVVSSAHPIHLAQLLPPGSLPQEFETLRDRWKTGNSYVAVDLALKEAPAFRTASGPSRSAIGLFGTSARIAAQREEDIPAGRLSGPGRWTQVICPSVVDPSRAPDGQATLKLVTSAPYALEGDPANWERQGESYGDQMVEEFADWVEDFSPGDELGRLVRTPVDFRLLSRANQGGLQGGDMTPDQKGVNRPVPGWASYRMPIPGLYQTGAGTFPGGGVSGWPGRNAARAVLGDLGVDLSSFASDEEL